MGKHRGHNEGSIYQRESDGRWVSSVTVAPGGKRKYIYGKTRKDVAEKLKIALRDQQQGLPVAIERQTVGQFLEHWIADVVRPSVRPKTHHSYSQVLRLYLKPALGHHQLAKLAPQHVQTMMNNMRARGQSPRTVQYARDVLRQALNQALKWGIVVRNVATLVDPPRSDSQPVSPLSAAEARSFLEHVKSQDSRLWPLIATALMTGLRQAELLGLRWSDVDLEGGTLRVAQTLQRVDGEWQYGEPKSKRSRRTLHLPTGVASALQAQQLRQYEEQLLAGDRWQNWGLVFTSTVGTPLEPSNLNSRLHSLLEDAQLPQQGIHKLRHCFASLLIAEGVSPRVVMEMLGHSQISLTMNTYAHVMPTMLEDAARAVDAVFGNRD